MKMNWKAFNRLGKGFLIVSLVLIFMSSCFVKSKFDNPTDGFGGLLLDGINVGNLSLIVIEGDKFGFQSKSTASIRIRLSENPGTVRVVTLESSNISELTVSPPRLTFNTLNWDIDQIVTITGSSNFCGSSKIQASGYGLISSNQEISISTETWGCFQDNNNGTVTFRGQSNLSGINLIWMKCSQGQTWNSTTNDCDGGSDYFKYCSINDNSCNNDSSIDPNWTLNGNGNSSIYTSCNDLNTSVVGGYGNIINWRVPTKEELKSLIYCANGPSTPYSENITCNTGYSSPTIIDRFFPRTVSDNYWTSTAYSEDSLYAYFIDFSIGYVFNPYLKDLDWYLRCVSRL